jgi:hypothetical protein
VSIGLSNGSGFVEIQFSTSCWEAAGNLVLALDDAEIVCSRLSQLELRARIDNYDSEQLAEHIALSLEKTGLKVRRLISRPGADDRSPSMIVSSFISLK